MKTSLTSRLLCETHVPRLVALTLLAGLLLCAIAHGQTNNAAADPAGVYTLISVDGKTVPCSVSHGKQTMFVQSGTFTISTNSECLSQIIISHGSQTNVVCNTQATFTLKDSKLHMLWRNGGRTRGTVDGNTFTMTNEGMAFIYQK